VNRLHADAVRVLRAWRSDEQAGTGQERLRQEFLEHLGGHRDGVLRSCVPAHLTASALVLDATGERVLLTLHRKGGFWGQFGGHCEPGDQRLADAALREAREESGIADLLLAGDEPVDLDRHALSGAFGSCREHLDVRYAAVAPAGAEPVVSHESHDVVWFAHDALPPGAVPDLARLVERARAALSATAARG
jgi:8-oxo-dGTP pyrophosphatase MutT (NUDIX family)